MGKEAPDQREDEQGAEDDNATGGEKGGKQVGLRLAGVDSLMS